MSLQPQKAKGQAGSRNTDEYGEPGAISPNIASIIGEEMWFLFCLVYKVAFS